MKITFRLLYVALFSSGLALYSTTWASDTVSLPEGEKTQWENLPVESYGGEHARQVINGLWKFQPGDPKNPSAQPEDQWSWIQVPGSWHRRPDWNELGVRKDGDTKLWKRFAKEHRKWPLGWYQRQITVPADWKGRRTFLDFTDLSTEAKVWVDGKFVGGTKGPRGRVELTKQIQPGTTQELRVQVAAVPPDKPSLNLQGEMTEQIILEPAKLNAFGIVWDTFLVSEPKGPVVTTPKITTLVKDSQFGITGQLARISKAQDAKLTVTVRDLEGKELKSWEKTAKLQPGKDKVAAFSFEENWKPERLWDIDDPYLLEATIQFEGEDWKDERKVRFGFREFEIVGKDIELNGVPIRLRPVPHIDMPHIHELVERYVQGIKSIGANLLMVREENGVEYFLDAADRYGLLIFAEVPEIKEYAVRGTWEENKEDWEQRMRVAIDRQFNHPSIVMWWSGFNVFAHGEDQNPARLGQLDELTVQNPEWERRIKVGLAAMDLMRQADPTRGVYSHNASIVGDLQTTNMYLNLIPLQEREEWLSDWAENATVPFLACEFGLPLNNTFMQGKAGGGWLTIGRPHAEGSANSAMMMTEYGAIYLGPEAYETQPANYHEVIRRSHEKGFVHDNGRRTPGLKLMHDTPAFQKLSQLFIENTFRSWRTWGMSGGMNLWNYQGTGWRGPSWRKNKDNIEMGSFKPGTLGTYRPEISKGLYHNFKEGGWERLPAGETLMANYGPVLAWIAGDAKQGFTDKDHHYFLGDVIKKQVALINDRRQPEEFTGTWSAELAGKTLGEGNIRQTVQPGTNVLLPMSVQLPEAVAGAKVKGQIKLQLKAGEDTLEDQFEFTVYAEKRPDPGAQLSSSLTPGAESTTPVDLFSQIVRNLWSTVESKPSTQGQVFLVAGDGSTKAWLQSLGVGAKPWSGKGQGVLVIGRGALEAGKIKLADVQSWVQDGGLLLISSPTPDWLQAEAGFRVTPHPSRRLFPLKNPHPALAGVDAEDLRDWNGTSTTVEGYPEYFSKLAVSGDKPLHGWRWGNRGSVASVAVEKPHHAAWRPILESEFDLAYSSLMELPYGKGLIVLSNLDLEDNVAVDPAARMVARQLLSYLEKPGAIGPVRGQVAYAGKETMGRVFEAMGVDLVGEDQAEDAAVLVLGRKHGKSDDQIKQWLTAGKNVLLLRGAELPAFSGWSWDGPKDFAGTTKVPDWPETAALSISDFHFRAPYAMTKLKGQGVGADGMLARKEVGAGVLMASAMDPTWIRTDQQPFMRLTAWRHSRALVSLIAALGGKLAMDEQIFRLEPLPTGRRPLAGEWKAKAIKLLPPSAKPEEGHQDPGISDAARAAIAKPGEGEGWYAYQAPGAIEMASDAWESKDGEFVMTRTVDVPEGWAGKDIFLELGRVDDHDVTFWNGVEVGSIGAEHPSPWSADRKFLIPGEQVKAGQNVIAIRVFDKFGGGGLTSHESKLRLRLKGGAELDWYHPDYRTDFAYGDDPYRYYRW